MILSIPSKGINWQELGSQDISGLEPSTYHTLSFPVDEGTRAILESEYSDLTIIIVLNAPRLSAPYLLDRLQLTRTIQDDAPFYILSSGQTQTTDPMPSQFAPYSSLYLGIDRPNAVPDEETYGEWSCDNSSVVDSQDGMGIDLSTGEFPLSFRALSLLDKGDGCDSSCCGNDFAVPSALFNNDFYFTYRSSLQYTDTMGTGWDFNYGSRAFLDGNDILILDGAGSQRRYTPGASGEPFIPEPGVFRELRLNASGAIRIRYPNSTEVEYHAFDGTVLSGRLINIEDRDGNTRTLSYDSDGILQQVIDGQGRVVSLSYDENGMLSSLEDFTGRSTRFFYDESYRLTKIRLPVVVGTTHGNGFPDGVAYRFAYDESNRMIARTYPNEVTSDGPPRISLSYESEGRVLSENIDRTNESGRNVGGTIGYVYHAATEDVPARTEVDRNGNLAEYLFDEQRTVSVNRSYSNRNIRPDDPEYFETAFSYDDQLNLINKVFPLSNSESAVYDNESDDYLARGNKLVDLRLPDAERGGDQIEIRTEYDYEPVYQQVARIRHPQEFEFAQSNPACFVHPNASYIENYIFDYQEVTSLAALAKERGIPESVLADRFSEAELASRWVM